MTTLFLPYNKEFAYSNLLKSCGKGDWIYQRIFKNKTPIDIVMLGSSKMQCGVTDSLLETALNKRPETQIHVSNLSFCQYGRSLHYSIFKDVLKKHKPKILILEIREQESKFSHPGFRFIADAEDILTAPLHQSYLPTILFGAISRINFNLQSVFPKKQTNQKSSLHSDHFATTIHKNADSEVLERRINSVGSNSGFNWQYNFSRNFLKKIITLANQAGTKVYFLYLPSYGSISKSQLNGLFYRLNGNLLIPPKDIFENTNNWADEVHLNNEGATILTYWVAENLFIKN